VSNVVMHPSRVIHVTSWLSRQGGGIPPVVWGLAGQSRKLGVDCSVAGLKDAWSEEDCQKQGVPFVLGAIKGPVALGYSPELADQLRFLVTPGSVVHSHGLWMHPGVAARKCARGVGCPLVISPHGMLEPWALNNARWKKRIAARMFEDGNLSAADCLHALCLQEADHMRQYGLRNPIAVIPNGVDMDTLQPLPERDAILGRWPKLKGRRRLLFLSRLHPKKGLSPLLSAWQRLARNLTGWCLIIGGSGEPAYEDELKSEARRADLEGSVFFLGPVYGEDRKQALAAADAFVLPSFSEGFSMAILEAAGVGLPVVFTEECNFPELAAAGAGIETASGSDGVESGLRRMLQMSDEQRSEMGGRGTKLIQQNYVWSSIARQMFDLYAWLAGKGSKPAFVHLY
jgi:glycosyltransferase involved in cell wall biosynthesis